jgi:hypothetical protein
MEKYDLEGIKCAICARIVWKLFLINTKDSFILLCGKCKENHGNC